MNSKNPAGLALLLPLCPLSSWEMCLALGMPTGSEWIWIFLAILVLFGAKKLPELARGLGKSLGEFRRAKDEFEREIHHAGEKEESKSAPSGTKPSEPSVPGKN
jgi:sec-independent protein translocase protein TatA